MRLCTVKSLFFIIILVFVLLFAGCDLSVQPSQEERVDISVKIGLPAMSKAIQPVIREQVKSFRISFSNGPEEYQDIVTTETEFLLDDFWCATWDVRVDGYNDKGDVIVWGEEVLDVEYIIRYHKTFNVDLSIDRNGTGPVDLTVDWSDSNRTIETVEASLFYREDNSSKNIDMNVSGYSASYKAELSSGSYLLRVNLISGGVVQASCIEAVNVYDNFSSAGTIYLFADDFNSPPPPVYRFACLGSISGDRTVME